jgi:hypothetical protein
MWDRKFIDGESTPATRHTYAWKNCTIRAVGSTNPTVIIFEFVNVGLAYDHLHLYAVGPGLNRVATATLSITGAGELFECQAVFTEVSAVTVAGFELECDEGLDTSGTGTPIPYDHMVDGDIVNTGTATHSSVGSNPRPDTLKIGFSTVINDSSASFANECQIAIHAKCYTHNTALNYAVYLYSVTGGSGNRFSLSDVYGWGAGHPGFDFTAGPTLLQTGSFGDTGPSDDFQAVLRIDNKPDSGTGLFTTFGNVYITSALLLARKATIQPGYLYNVCPA